MKTIFLGKNCIEVEQTDSTNSYLARLLVLPPTPLLGERGVKGVFEGTVVIAKQQLQGRGQRGASWESEPNKNLTLSILLQPTFLRTEDQFQLNKAVSLGVAEFISSPLIPLSPRRGGVRSGTLLWGESGERGDVVSIKWPNDIYIGNKKIAGILIENSVSGNKLQQSIIGIGININQEKFSAELPNPTSLKLIRGKEFDLKECLEELCSCIERRYLQLRNPHSSPELRSQPSLSARLSQGEGGIDADYLKNLYRFGEWANYKYKGDALKAKIIKVTKVGKLVLEIENGEKLECDFKELGFC
jgi:BirA family transcriptional regulator, biotin operon repressor / biotin---[acetyl-CoA-carboxylase] ligase